ncbi:MAG: hypothetical protein NVSMB56_17210 [Pyrinomonadaceae bacterium]
MQTLPDYTPAKPAYQMTNIAAAHIAMNTAQANEVRATAAAATARDAVTQAGWDHYMILSMKEQAIALYIRVQSKCNRSV